MANAGINSSRLSGLLVVEYSVAAPLTLLLSAKDVVKRLSVL